MLTVGVDNLSGSSNVTVTGNIKLTATGGDGGAVYQFGLKSYTGQRGTNISNRESKW